MENKRKEIIQKIYPFVIITLFMCLYLFPRESMTMYSGDSKDIWQSVVTYGTDQMYPLYKTYDGYI